MARVVVVVVMYTPDSHSFANLFIPCCGTMWPHYNHFMWPYKQEVGLQMYRKRTASLKIGY